MRGEGRSGGMASEDGDFKLGIGVEDGEDGGT